MKIKPLVFEPLSGENDWWVTDYYGMNYEYRIRPSGVLAYRLPQHVHFKVWNGNIEELVKTLNDHHVKLLSQFLES